MPAMPIKEIQNHLEQLAQYDSAALRRASLVELRDISRGIIPDVHKYRKGDLVKAIETVTKETRDRVATPVAQGSLKDSCDWLYQKLREIEYPLLDDRGQKIEVELSAVFGAFVADQVTGYAPSTQKSNKGKVIEALDGHLNDEENEVVTALTPVIEDFEKMYSAWVSGISKAVNKAYREQVNDTQRKLKPVSELQSWINHAKQVLANPQGFHWTEVSKAVCLATGRRMAEVHSSGIFTALEPHLLHFSGQLKTRGAEGTKSEFDIHTPFDADHIVKAVEHLAAVGRRCDDHKRVNGLYSEPLSRAMKPWGVPYKELRDIHAEMSYSLYKRLPEFVEMSKPAYFVEVLGHSKNTTTAAMSYHKFRESEFDSLEF